MADLIPIAEARGRVLQAVRALPAESVALGEALGRVLAEDVRSEISVPPFDSSAMDGYAVVAGEGGELELIGEARAGHPAQVAVRPGAAVAISTGGEVPEGATAVVPVERTERADGSVRVPATESDANIRRAGEDIAAGDLVLRAGTVLRPAAIGVAASVGRDAVSCTRRPRVALVLTGDELTDPGEPLRPGGIYSSNGYALAGQVVQEGAELVASERVGDSADATRTALAAALEAADVVVVSGGVSVGPHDHVKSALAALGVEERFWGVALRPGKPTWFGTRDDTLVFGLPGNPVSAMVTFILFARPAALAMQGRDPAAPRATAVLEEGYRKKPGRAHAIRCALRPGDEGWLARPTKEQGSHVLTSMLGADALAILPTESGDLQAGERVTVELLPGPTMHP
jgi:molybdopterin molybdotransferase